MVNIISQKPKDGERAEGLSVNSRRMSGGDSSLDGSRSITSQSQSETRSYRDRLKDRFQSVKVRNHNRYFLQHTCMYFILSHISLFAFVQERAGNMSEVKTRKNVTGLVSHQVASQSQVDELVSFFS